MGIRNFISGAVKIITLPIDAVEIGIDLTIGGDGSRRELKQCDLPLLSEFRDSVTDVIKDI